MAVSIPVGAPQRVTLASTYSLVQWSPVTPRSLSISAPAGVDVYVAVDVTDGGAIASAEYWVVPGGSAHTLDVGGLPSLTLGLAASASGDVSVWATP